MGIDDITEQIVKLGSLMDQLANKSNEQRTRFEKVANEIDKINQSKLFDVETKLNQTSSTVNDMSSNIQSIVEPANQAGNSIARWQESMNNFDKGVVSIRNFGESLLNIAQQKFDNIVLGVAGIEIKFDGLNKKIEDAARALILLETSFQNSVSNVINGISHMAQGFVSLAIQGIPAAVSGIKTFAVLVRTAAQTSLTNIVTGMGNIAKTGREFAAIQISNVVNGFKSFMSAVTEGREGLAGLVTGLKNVGKISVVELVTGIKKLGVGIKEIGGNVISSTAIKISDLSAKAKEFAGTKIEQVRSGFERVKSSAISVKDRVIDVAKSIRDVAQSKIENTAKGMKGLAESAKGFISQRIETVKEKLKGTREETKNGGKETETLSQKLGKLGKTTFGTIHSGLNKIGSLASAAATKVFDAMKKVGKAIKGQLVDAVNTGREFEEEMSNVSATLMIDKSTAEGQKDYEMLENAARECGRSSSFSAKEGSAALNHLALAGYDAAEAATSLPAVMRLAGAGAMDLAAASDLVAQGLSSLGLDVTEENLNSFTDQLAQTADASKANMKELGESILAVGDSARKLKGGSAEMNAMLGILSDIEIKGSDAGKNLSNTINALSTDKAAAELGKYGISAIDAQGNLRGLNEVFGEMNAAMEGKSADVQDAWLSSIFDEGDMKAVKGMMEGVKVEVDDLGNEVVGAASRFDQLTDTIENSSGACQDMFDIRNDNLNSDIDLFKSGVADLQIELYNGMVVPLRNATQMGTGLIGDLSTAFQQGGLEGFIGEIGNVLAEVVTVIAEYAPMVVEMALSLVDNLITGLETNSGKIAQGAAKAISTLVKGFLKMLPKVLVLGMKILTELIDGLMKELPEMISAAGQGIQTFMDGFMQYLPQIIALGLELIQILADALVENMDTIMEAAGAILRTLGDGILQAVPILIPAVISIIMSILQHLLSPETITYMLEAALFIILSLADGLTSMLPTLIPVAIQAILTILMGLVEALPMVINSAIGIILALVEGLINALPIFIAMAPVIIENFIQAIVGAIPMLIDAAINIIISLATYLINNLPVILQAAYQIITAIYVGLLNALSKIVEGAGRIVSALINFIKETDWLEVGKGIINSIISGITGMVGKVGDAAKGVVDSIAGIFTGESKDEVVTAAHDTGEAIVDSLETGIENGIPEVENVSSELAFGATESLMPDMSEIEGYGMDVSTGFASGIDSGAEAAINAASSLAAQVEENGNAEMDVILNDIDTAPLAAALPVIDDFQTSSSGTFNQLSGDLEAITPTMQNFSDLIVSTFESLRASFSEITPELQSFSDSIKGTFEALPTSIESGISALSIFKQSITETFQELPAHIALAIISLVQFNLTIDIVSLALALAMRANILEISLFRMALATAMLAISISILAMIPVLLAFKISAAGAFQAVANAALSMQSTIRSINLYEDGQNIVSGLISGMNSKREALVATARSMANTVQSAFKTAMQIKSPSRVMMPLGEDTVRGVIAGEENRFTDLEKASERIADITVSATAGAAEQNVPGIDFHALDIAKPSEGTSYNYSNSVSSDAARTDRKIILNIDRVIDKVEVHDEADEDRLAEKVLNVLLRVIEENDGNTGMEVMGV